MVLLLAYDFLRGGDLSGGCRCLGEGRLGLPGQVWELRFLPSFPSFPRELSAPNRKSHIASDFKSRIPNRKKFPQIAVKEAQNHTFKSPDL